MKDSVEQHLIRYDLDLDYQVIVVYTGAPREKIVSVSEFCQDYLLPNIRYDDEVVSTFRVN